MSPLLSKSSAIVVVGAGVFGLSTALHLAQKGYTDITVLDRQSYQQTRYRYRDGCDAASADLNKIIRAAYGPEFQYQTLALDAITKWKKWNDEISSGKTVPPGFTTSDKLFVNNGCITMTTGLEIDSFEVATALSMDRVGLKDSQVDLHNPEHVKRAKSQGFGFAVEAFNNSNASATLDTQSGFAYADKACLFALHKAEKLGVKFVLGPVKGSFRNYLEDSNGRINGVQTADDMSHPAELTIMACGGWTPTLLPQLDHLCETTAGSVAMFQLPNDQQLWDKFGPENFPTWSFDIRRGRHGGLYGFARDEQGVVKIGYRGTKFTNPQTQADGSVRSVPITRYTNKAIREIPEIAVRTIKSFVEVQMPELLNCASTSRLCWYTDSYDNHFVIDFVPDKKGLLVATGGSGHGFKFLPNIGEHVVDRIEGNKNDLLRYWNWRTPDAGTKRSNNIMEGISSNRSLHHQPLINLDRTAAQTSRL